MCDSKREIECWQNSQGFIIQIELMMVIVRTEIMKKAIMKIFLSGKGGEKHTVKTD